MKIMMLCRCFPPKIGGLHKSNYEISKAINDLGYDLNVLVIGRTEKDKKFDGEEEFSIERTGFKKIKGSVNFFSFFPRVLTTLYSWRKIKKKIKDLGPDKIIFADDYARMLLGIFPVNSLTNSEIITITSVPRTKKMLDSTLMTHIRNVIIKKCYRKTDKLVYVSNSTKKELYNYFGNDLFADKNEKIIYRTVDDKFIEQDLDEEEVESIINECGIEKDKKIVLSVSRITKDKGIDKVLKALKKYKEEDNDDFHYLIVGDGEYLPRIEEMIEELNLREHVTTTGSVDFDDVIHYYDLCDIFVLPSNRKSSESFGRVYAEASARGKPVIGNNTGGVREVIDHKKTGFLVNPNDTKEIHKRINELLSKEKLRKKMGGNGSEKVKETFTSKQLKKKIKEVLTNRFQGNLHFQTTKEKNQRSPNKQVPKSHYFSGYDNKKRWISYWYITVR